MGINNIRNFVLSTLSIVMMALVCGAVSHVFPQNTISPSQTTNIELDSGKPTVFEFDATPDKVHDFIFNHTGTSLKVTVTSPKGKKVTSLISPTLLTGTLPLFFRTKEAGKFRITLEAERPGRTIGQVTVTYKDARPYEQSDSDRLRAWSLISSSQDVLTYLYTLKVDRSRRDVARRDFKEAITICEKLSDRRCVANAALDLGQFEYDEFGDLNAAETTLRRAIDEYSQLGDEAGLSLSKLRIALAIGFIRGRDPEILPLLDQAIESARKIKDRSLEGRAFTIKGRILRDWGEGGKGFDLLKQAIDLCGDADLDGRFRAMVQATSTAGVLVDPSFRLRFDTTLEAFKELEGRIIPTYIPYLFSVKAGLAKDNEDFKTYELFMNRAAAAAEALGQKRYLAFYLLAIGSSFLETKQKLKARPYLERSLKLYEEVAPREAQAVYNAMGRHRMDVADPKGAKAFFIKAVELNQKNGDKYAATISLDNLVDAHLLLQNYDEAMSAAEKAYTYAISLRGNYYTAVTLNSFDLGILRDTTERMISASYRMFEKTGDVSYLERALEIQEISIARSLANTVSDSGFDIASAIDKDLLKKLSDTQNKISELEVSIQTDPKNKKESERSLMNLLVDYDDLLEQSRKLNPNSTLFSELAHISAKDIRALLDDETVLIQYSIKFGESHVWVIGKDVSKFHLLGQKQEINDLSNEYSKEISAYSSRNALKASSLGVKLSSAILKPILKDLTQFKRVLIVPDEDLVAAPFAAIPIVIDGKRKFLGEQFEIGVLPSVSTLLALRSVRRQKLPVDDKNLLAVIADPVFDASDDRLKRTSTTLTAVNSDLVSTIIKGSAVKSLTRLPFTSVEARQISEIATGRSAIFSGLEAKRDTVMKGGVSNFRIIHFATHGFLNSDKPELSSIALSMYDSSGNPQNGFLRALDIYSLRLKADLVVLGGCQTAGIAKIRGDNLAGLTRGFMYAGVPTVMASLWKVDDAATSYFMKYFYEALLTKGMTPPAALRDAQLRFIESPRWNSPKYWAAFTVQGEYDVTFK